MTVSRRPNLLARVPVLTAVFALSTGVLYAFPPAPPALQYDLDAPPASQLYRPLTCHLTHWSANHLGWSALAFAVLGAACERRGRGRFAACVLGSALAVPVALRLLQPAVATYRGLSGIDSGLFVLLATLLLRERIASRTRGRRGWAVAIVAVLAAFVGKVAFEFATGSAVFADNAAGGFVPVPLAHLAGAAAGLLAGLPWVPVAGRCRHLGSVALHQARSQWQVLGGLALLALSGAAFLVGGAVFTSENLPRAVEYSGTVCMVGWPVPLAVGLWLYGRRPTPRFGAQSPPPAAATMSDR